MYSRSHSPTPHVMFMPFSNSILFYHHIRELAKGLLVITVHHLPRPSSEWEVREIRLVESIDLDHICYIFLSSVIGAFPFPSCIFVRDSSRQPRNETHGEEILTPVRNSPTTCLPACLVPWHHLNNTVKVNNTIVDGSHTNTPLYTFVLRPFTLSFGWYYLRSLCCVYAKPMGIGWRHPQTYPLVGWRKRWQCNTRFKVNVEQMAVILQLSLTNKEVRNTHDLCTTRVRTGREIRSYFTHLSPLRDKIKMKMTNNALPQPEDLVVNLILLCFLKYYTPQSHAT